jgi:hypothetical protein
LKAILSPCTGQGADTCPELFLDNDPSATRPFAVTDLHEPRGTAWFTQAELLSLGDDGSDTVTVKRTEGDVEIIDALGNELAMTSGQFDDLVASIKDGRAHKAMAAAA